jgi:sortase B
MKKISVIFIIIAIAGLSVYLTQLYISSNIQEDLLVKKEENENNQTTITMRDDYIKDERNDLSEDESKELAEVSEETEMANIATEALNLTILNNKNKAIIEEIEDYMGWISIRNTAIDYPIVKGSDNEFYLNRNVYKKANIAGSIFMDRRNIGNGLDSHLIIYGHLMNDGSMFSALNKYKEQNFYNNNKYVEIENLYTTEEFEVIAAYIVSADEYTLDFRISKDVIDKWLQKSLIKTSYTFDENHKFLTLSTCNYTLDNGRILVHAVKKEASN